MREAGLTMQENKILKAEGVEDAADMGRIAT
jgi:hypothetical protein